MNEINIHCQDENHWEARIAELEAQFKEAQQGAEDNYERGIKAGLMRAEKICHERAVIHSRHSSETFDETLKRAHKLIHAGCLECQWAIGLDWLTLGKEEPSAL